jgi:uncharacterized protein YacL
MLRRIQKSFVWITAVLGLIVAILSSIPIPNVPVLQNKEVIASITLLLMSSIVLELAKERYFTLNKVDKLLEQVEYHFSQ